ncbi:MAG: YvrJ family protein [Coprothermobacterota bacterium]|nr:YvrJ family protein [Coprothermobacterota bacterium]
MANYGFPIVVASYLLVRVEGKLEKLTLAIADLARVVAELQGRTTPAPSP